MELIELAVSSVFEGLRWVTQKLLLLPQPKDTAVPVMPAGRGTGPLAAVRSALCRVQPCCALDTQAQLLFSLFPSGSLDGCSTSLMPLPALLAPAA